LIALLNTAVHTGLVMICVELLINFQFNHCYNYTMMSTALDTVNADMTSGRAVTAQYITECVRSDAY
jgi:hypothetical protein